ncbi:MAG: hypothetical protein D6775_15590, partial [Caldilineae bacterium]
ALGTVPGSVQIDAGSNVAACRTAGNSRCQLAISVTSPAGAGRVTFDTLETFNGKAATLTIVRKVQP